jgi:hypothetical protein
VLRASAALLFGCLSLGAAGALEAPPLPELRVNPSRQPPQQLVLVPPVLMAATDSVPEAAPSSQRSTAALPRLLPPTDLGEVPSRREAIERAIVQHHPDLVNGPERHGTAFISLWLRADSSVERSELRFVAPGEDAGLDEGDAAAMEKYFDPGSGRLMLAPGWQIADGATLRSQVVVSYRAAPGNLVGGGRLKSRSFSPADVYRVVEGYMPDAYSERRLAAGSIPFLVLSQDGQVLRHGYLEAGFTTNAMESANPDLQLTNSTFLISGGDAAGNGKKRHSVAIAWVVR